MLTVRFVLQVASQFNCHELELMEIRLCKTHANDNKPDTNNRPRRESKQVQGAGERICRHPDWSPNLPKKPNKPVSKAPKAIPKKATPRAAPKIKKDPAPTAGKEVKCQQKTHAGSLCRNKAVEGSVFCEMHQKSRLDKGKNDDDFGPDCNQDDDDDKPKKKPPTWKIKHLKKTATKPTTTSEPARKAALAKTPARKPAAKNKVVE